MEIPQGTYITASPTATPAKQISTLHSLTISELRSFGLSAEWPKRYPTYDTFLKAYAPTHWGYATGTIGLVGVWREANPHPCPSVGALDTLYGQGSAKRWMRTCLTSVAFGSSEKDMGMIQALEDACPCLVETMRSYKVLEVMIFFAQFKGGAFKTYGKFDPKNIGETFTNQFVPKCLKARAEAEEENRKYRAKLAEERFCFTRPQWEAYKAADDNTLYQVTFRYTQRMTHEREWDKAMRVRTKNVNGIRESLVTKSILEKWTPIQANGTIVVMDIKPLICPESAPSANANSEDDKVINQAQKTR